MKRYRRPKMKSGELKSQYGRIDGNAPDLCYFPGEGVPKCDMHLVHDMFCGKRQVVNWDAPLGSHRFLWTKFEPSFLEELESRGYDLTTLKFSIQKKETK